MPPENKCPYSWKIHHSVTTPEEKERKRIGLEIFEDLLTEFEKFADTNDNSKIEAIYQDMQNAIKNNFYFYNRQKILMDFIHHILTQYMEDLIVRKYNNYDINPMKIKSLPHSFLDGVIKNLSLWLKEIIYLYILNRNTDFPNFKTSILRLMKASSDDVAALLKLDFKVPDFVNNSKRIPIQKDKPGCMFLYFTDNKELLDRFIVVLEKVYDQLEEAWMTFTFTKKKNIINNIIENIKKILTHS